jgi:hypothetical protein
MREGRRRKSFLVLFFQKNRENKRFFLKKEAKTLAPSAAEQTGWIAFHRALALPGFVLVPTKRAITQQEHGNADH